MELKNLYDKDFYAWTMATANTLKKKAFNDIDLEHLIEEIESMGASDFRELRSRLIILIAHLLKWDYQQSQRSSGWKGTIIEQRMQLQGLLEQSPSLNSKAADLLNDAKFTYLKSLKIASEETGIAKKAFPETCPYTLDQILDDDFYPDN